MNNRRLKIVTILFYVSFYFGIIALLGIVFPSIRKLINLNPEQSAIFILLFPTPALLYLCGNWYRNFIKNPIIRDEYIRPIKYGILIFGFSLTFLEYFILQDSPVVQEIIVYFFFLFLSSILTYLITDKHAFGHFDILLMSLSTNVGICFVYLLSLISLASILRIQTNNFSLVDIFTNFIGLIPFISTKYISFIFLSSLIAPIVALLCASKNIKTNDSILDENTQ